MGRIYRPIPPVLSVFRFQNGCRSISLAPIILASLFVFSNASAAPPLKATDWLISFDRAMSEARKQDRIVLAYFSGSDWDPWCQKLDEEVFNTSAFREWATQHLILLRIDFPRE